MIDLKGFRKMNGLTQDELGEFLGMKKSFISKVENGREKLPYAKLQKLLTNGRGWDTSLLLEDSGIDTVTIQQRGGIGKVVGDGTAVAALEKEIEMLRAQVEELKAEKAAYWEMIKELTKK